MANSMRLGCYHMSRESVLITILLSVRLLLRFFTFSTVSGLGLVQAALFTGVFDLKAGRTLALLQDGYLGQQD